jgi:uncharacterized protein (TIGR02217 family)
MSYPMLTLPLGVGWNYKKSPKYSTTIQYPRSAIHPAVSSLQHSVVYDIELVFNYLKQNGVTTSDDFQYLEDFYEANRGAYGRFLFDPSQCNFETMAVSSDTTQLKNGFFGVGDGVTTVFPLWRSTTAVAGSLTRLELIQYVTMMGGVYINGVATTAYTLSQCPAQVTFTTAPANGATLSWGGDYAYLCHFAEDTVDFNQFLYEIWELKSCRFETVLL